MNDGNWQYERINVRQLARIHSIDTDASFVYNEKGLMVQKTVNGVVTDYVLHGKNVVHMTQGNAQLHFFYDTSNKPAVVVYNGVPYSYVKNLQGDIVALLDSTGTVVVSYVYDAWGRPISKTGSLASTLGTVQPFRYRGYVYDEETGLYYLRSRYYSTYTLRFINADVICGENLYCYANNSVVGRTDNAGTESQSISEESAKNFSDFVQAYFDATGLMIWGISIPSHATPTVQYTTSTKTIESAYATSRRIWRKISDGSGEISRALSGYVAIGLQCIQIPATPEDAESVMSFAFNLTSAITDLIDTHIVEEYFPQLNDVHTHTQHTLVIDWADIYLHRTTMTFESCDSEKCPATELSTGTRVRYSWE